VQNMNIKHINESRSREFSFHAVPGQIDSFLLRDYYQRRMLDSLKVYLLSISKSIDVDLSLQTTKIDELDCRRRLSPCLYTLYVQIKEAYEKRALDEILDCIQLLNNEPSESLYADHLQYSTILTERWEAPFLREIRETILVDQSVYPSPSLNVFPLIHWGKDDFPPPFFHCSLDLLKTLDYPLFLEVQAYVSRIKFCSSKMLNSVTSPRYFGAVYMRLPFAEEDPELFFLETLVHETSHLHLFAIMDRNVLILNDEQDLYASPLKAHGRPMTGVFHSVFVLSRMVRILRRYCNVNPNKADAEKLLRQREAQLEEGLSTISTEAQLTEEGKALVNTLEECAIC
jgi:hypothetical protein